MNKFGKFMKGVFVDKLWIKLIAAAVAARGVGFRNICAHPPGASKAAGFRPPRGPRGGSTLPADAGI